MMHAIVDSPFFITVRVLQQTDHELHPRKKQIQINVGQKRITLLFVIPRNSVREAIKSYCVDT